MTAPALQGHATALSQYSFLLDGQQLGGDFCYVSVQVALLSGLDSDGQKKLYSTKDSDHHLNKLLRLLTVRTELGRDRSGIALVGGPHDPKADGSATQRCCS